VLFYQELIQIILEYENKLTFFVLNLKHKKMN